MFPEEEIREMMFNKILTMIRYRGDESSDVNFSDSLMQEKMEIIRSTLHSVYVPPVRDSLAHEREMAWKLLRNRIEADVSMSSLSERKSTDAFSSGVHSCLSAFQKISFSGGALVTAASLSVFSLFLFRGVENQESGQPLTADGMTSFVGMPDISGGSEKSDGTGEIRAASSYSPGAYSLGAHPFRIDFDMPVHGNSSSPYAFGSRFGGFADSSQLISQKGIGLARESENFNEWSAHDTNTLVQVDTLTENHYRHSATAPVDSSFLRFVSNE
jgi:hypothetical protein